MTPREKALEAALINLLNKVNYLRAFADVNTAKEQAREALATPSDDWQPTPLADPPGDAVIEDGDWVRTRSGCVLGPVHTAHSGTLFWSKIDWSERGKNTMWDLTITHVRKAVKSCLTDPYTPNTTPSR